jgi:uncharacterized short protein YbdD (DUF466 family)
MENSINKNEYYTGIMMDVRDVFIGYGRYLEKNSINEQGDISDYENYLHNREEENCTNYQLNNDLSDRNIEYIEFISWILEQSHLDEQLNVIRQEEWDRFWESEDKDDEIDMEIVQAGDFYKEFEKLVGIDDFDECFVHMKYINELQNSVNLIVNINGINQRFIIDVL